MEGPFGELECEKCGGRFPRARMRRLFWIRVCLSCEKSLSGVRPLGVPESVERRLGEGGPTVLSDVIPDAEDDGLRAELLHAARGAVRPALLLLAIVVASRFLGPKVASFAGGVLAAEVLTWGIFSLIRAPFEQVTFLVRLFVRVVALVVIQGPGLPGLSEASRLDLGAVGFLGFLIVRAFWFACWWNELVDDPLDDGADPGLSVGRLGSVVAPPRSRR